MKDQDTHSVGISRRELLKLTGVGVAALGLGACDNSGSVIASALASETSQAAKAGMPYAGPYNILFILTDQERFSGQVNCRLASACLPMSAWSNRAYPL